MPGTRWLFEMTRTRMQGDRSTHPAGGRSSGPSVRRAWASGLHLLSCHRAVWRSSFRVLSFYPELVTDILQGVDEPVEIADVSPVMPAGFLAGSVIVFFKSFFDLVEQ